MAKKQNIGGAFWGKSKSVAPVAPVASDAPVAPVAPDNLLKNLLKHAEFQSDLLAVLCKISIDAGDKENTIFNLENLLEGRYIEGYNKGIYPDSIWANAESILVSINKLKENGTSTNGGKKKRASKPKKEPKP